MGRSVQDMDRRAKRAADVMCSFSGLVVMARARHPIPSRTRKLRAVAPMVLRLKTWESRSPPNLKRNTNQRRKPEPDTPRRNRVTTAGWSSPVARQAHNLKVVGSNPTPATRNTHNNNALHTSPGTHAGAFVFASTPPQHSRRESLPRHRRLDRGRKRRAGTGDMVR